ncbi:MAG: SDR family NAD(P)-dependent oxidoreductase [Acidimicrobiales bacterium]
MITGASSGIGLAFAERFAADGHDLIVVARSGDRLRALKDRLESSHGVSVEVVTADLASESGMHEVDSIAAERPLDVLVDNAALAHYMNFLELSQDKLDELVHLNVLAPARLIRAAVPGMVERSHGTVISIATQLVFSATADNPQLPQRAVYAATKSFLFTLIRVLAMELRDSGIKMQVVCPGVVKTEFHTRQGMDMSHIPRLEPEDVVTASLRGLELGEIVCQPGLEDTDLLRRRDEADLAVLQGGMRPTLAARYNQTRPIGIA